MKCGDKATDRATRKLPHELFIATFVAATLVWPYIDGG